MRKAKCIANEMCIWSFIWLDFPMEIFTIETKTWAHRSELFECGMDAQMYIYIYICLVSKWKFWRRHGAENIHGIAAVCVCVFAWTSVFKMLGMLVTLSFRWLPVYCNRLIFLNVCGFHMFCAVTRTRKAARILCTYSPTDLRSHNQSNILCFFHVRAFCGKTICNARRQTKCQQRKHSHLKNVYMYYYV